MRTRYKELVPNSNKVRYINIWKSSMIASAYQELNIMKFYERGRDDHCRLVKRIFWNIKSFQFMLM
eukprot:UN18290